LRIGTMAEVRWTPQAADDLEAITDLNATSVTPPPSP
jgi:plasmid stabilization system protein ParE